MSARALARGFSRSHKGEPEHGHAIWLCTAVAAFSPGGSAMSLSFGAVVS